MLRKKLQVMIPGGIHMAVALTLGQISKREDAHVFLMAKGRMVSARESQKVLALGIRKGEWIEVMVDSEGGEEAEVIEQVEKVLGCL
ncbi:MAG: HPr family phosphocarrier protein [Lachnospiraceae bacterium]|jgi:phosphotransferase system HPr (HPr) family protein|nr:HPr family phosphocarrier protein [Lachnospiraceae bacterium]